MAAADIGFLYDSAHSYASRRTVRLELYPEHVGVLGNILGRAAGTLELRLMEAGNVVSVTPITANG